MYHVRRDGLGCHVSTADVTFRRRIALEGLMDASIAVIKEQPSVEAAYRSDSDRLWRSVYAYAGNAEIASDAVAEAFAQLIRRGDGVRDPAAWAWRTAIRIAAGAMKARRASDRMTVVAPEEQPGYLDRHGDPDLLAALRQLPEEQRAAVILDDEPRWIRSASGPGSSLGDIQRAAPRGRLRT